MTGIKSNDLRTVAKVGALALVLGLLVTGQLASESLASAGLQQQRVPVLQVLTYDPASGAFADEVVEVADMAGDEPNLGTATALTVSSAAGQMRRGG